MPGSCHEARCVKKDSSELESYVDTTCCMKAARPYTPEKKEDSIDFSS
jgi:hypothetical protein